MNFENAKGNMLSIMAPSIPQTRTCSACKRPEPTSPTPSQTLKRCARCHITIYCSRECQKAHWKADHKNRCIWGAIRNNIYLDSLPEEDAMEQLIDVYRMRVEDDYKFRGDAHGLYGLEDPLDDFEEFLDLAEGQMEKEKEDAGGLKRAGILPKWWCEEKRNACERKAMRDPWCRITYAVEKGDIQEHYKDDMMPMKLRMLGETVYGFNVMTF
ncbi:hypothetical protein DTO027B5_2821 [Paecilomyces variotii]|nr:hypothetical protein DTO169C6_6059 [Paecilomyces variotii]KAJ9289832.1 hypothetical protein DTO021C3_2546 [Paecilomyces variotii]KAJ9323684.1 hypothetical protein DTO027B3_5303 [Paecilomyces variotii]KAJ9335404.1 hypothetical protein DTO027B5_2821 [Paecilomyces variotii]KAJ9408495.1 hypothetical protein DTO045G8_3788 [Paecilomyces variotii]